MFNELVATGKVKAPNRDRSRSFGAAALPRPTARRNIKNGTYMSAVGDSSTRGEHACAASWVSYHHGAASARIFAARGTSYCRGRNARGVSRLERGAHSGSGDGIVSPYRPGYDKPSQTAGRRGRHPALSSVVAQALFSGCDRIRKQGLATPTRSRLSIHWTLGVMSDGRFRPDHNLKSERTMLLSLYLSLERRFS